MPLPFEEIERQLVELAGDLPQLLKDNQGVEFWIEFLERADAIRQRVPLAHQAWVTERLHGVLAAHGLTPPSHWVRALPGQTG